MDALRSLRVLIPNAKHSELEVLLAQAEDDFRNECRRDDIPDGARSVILRMVQYRYGQLDGAGLASQSYSGASESFLTDWPDDLKREMHRWRKAAFV